MSELVCNCRYMLPDYVCDKCRLERSEIQPAEWKELAELKLMKNDHVSRKGLREWCENELDIVKRESMSMPDDWVDQFELEGKKNVLNYILEQFCKGTL